MSKDAAAATPSATQQKRAQLSKDANPSKQSTLAAFFGKPRPNPVPRTAPAPAAEVGPQSTASTTAPDAAAPCATSPPSSVLRTPTSISTPSPATAASRPDRDRKSNRSGSPLKQSFTSQNTKGDDEALSAPSHDEDEDMEQRSRLLPVKKTALSSPLSGQDINRLEQNGAEKEDEEEEDGPILRKRSVKRKVTYIESDSESDAGPSRPPAKPRKSLKVLEDDDFEIDDVDDAALAAAAEEYEAAVFSDTASIVSSSPAPSRPSKTSRFKDKPFKPPASKPKQPTTSWHSDRQSSPPPPSSDAPSASSARRPGPKPLGGSRQADGEDLDSLRPGSAGGGGGSRSAGASDSWLLTAAERKKIDAKDAQREKENVFEFLQPENLKDRDGRRPTDPDYDQRTILIPKKTWNSFTPFEWQFWEIKQYHFDTVLFFQKGKFYELYEEDAAIGHREFDLKLTDRVKMKMVGVPEQSFEFWANKFIAAGYKVGKVEQTETAIGMGMRQKAEGGKKSANKADGIVQRGLKQVFTVGTIVDPAYISSDDANYCVAIKERPNDDNPNHPASYGICIVEASMGQVDMYTFQDDVCCTRLETLFRQVRPKELIHAKNNLSVNTRRILRNILPSSTQWQSFRDHDEFPSAADSLRQLGEIFQTTEDDVDTGKPLLPDAIKHFQDNEVAMEALGGMRYYLKTLNLDKEVLGQGNFNIYDPLQEGRNLVLDGPTLAHMEVLMNNEGSEDGTLVQLLQRCRTPFGKRLFRIWLTCPLRDARAINERLDAVEDIMRDPNFGTTFAALVKGLPDLERLISRAHAGAVKQKAFTEIMHAFDRIQREFERLVEVASSFPSGSVLKLIRSAPDLSPLLSHMNGLYKVRRDEKTMEILPKRGADEDCDAADDEVKRIEDGLDELLEEYQQQLKTRDVSWWHSAQGGKEIYQLQIPARTKVPGSWTKSSSVKAYDRYYTPRTKDIVHELLEARETQTLSKKAFFSRLLSEFDKDRSDWLSAVKVVAELDCLVSLAIASQNMEEPKCRPEFVDTPQAFIDFTDLRHPSMCLRADNFIPNNVQLGAERERTILLTGPNMAGKSTLLRMTAAGVIMAQMGCYVPASSARLSPIDRIQTRMGAYDNMFASASTFKVELDECSKILREAGPKSLVILDELGRGTSTYDGMAIAGAVLHHIATHTLPLAFFATHYGSLTDDFTYHPSIRKMHMSTRVDDELRAVVFLYKLIDGVAESSHGTHVAKMAGVPPVVLERADQVSSEFFDMFRKKLEGRRRSTLPLVAQADFAWLFKLVQGLELGTASGPGVGLIRTEGGQKASVAEQVDVIRRAIGHYEVS